MNKPASREAAAAEFKLGMRSLAGAVSIISTSDGGRRFGMTATAVCSATADPPAVLVCVNRGTTTHDAIARSGVFCVNVLRYEDRELSGVFSGAQKGESRFRVDQWTQLATGAPVLVNSLVAFDCRVASSLVHGTHTVYLGEVAEVRIGRKGKPLLYADGQYARLATLAHGEPLPEGLDYWGE
ncbi:MAG TPA: flavin reductase family protein [Burkholderiales bacterium]|nr:flavin reductase family protein [Burkholderiales bacterium]